MLGGRQWLPRGDRAVVLWRSRWISGGCGRLEDCSARDHVAVVLPTCEVQQHVVGLAVEAGTSLTMP